ncbi:MAG TPA: polyphosphate polymerase domain-containing protein [Urbifossiella sp.]|jgi:hypothetical protein
MRLVPEESEEFAAAKNSPRGERASATEVGELESPSLFADVGHGPAAFELKFLLEEDRARGVEEIVRRSLALDHHADPTRGNSYPTTSLYTDTPGFDVYCRRPAAGGCKYRVRRYGGDGPIFVEQKIKSGDRVRKRRAPVQEPELAAVGRGEPHPDWPGIWFHNGITEQQLRPVCRIAYDRVAYLGVAEGHTVRVTFDRHVRGETTTDWEVKTVGETPVLLAGLVICEFKFRLSMPAIFKEIVEEYGLTPCSVSKYRRFMHSRLETNGQVEGPGDA